MSQNTQININITSKKNIVFLDYIHSNLFMSHISPIDFYFFMSESFTGASDYIKNIGSEIEKSFSKAESVATEMGSNDQSRMAAMRIISFHSDDDTFEPSLERLREPMKKIRQLLEQKHQMFVEYPDNMNDMITLGLCYLILGNFPRSYVMLFQVHNVLKVIDDEYLLFALGVIYAHFHIYDKSIECFENMLKLNVDDDMINDVYFRMGIIERCRKRYNESLNYFSKINFMKKAYFTEDDLQFQIAYNDLLMGDINNSDKIFQNLFLKYPNSLENYQQYVMFKYLTSSDYDEVMDIIEKGLSKFKFDPVICFIGGLIEIKKENMMGAYNFYTLCLSYYTDSPYFWCGFGIIYFKNRQYEDSLVAFQRAIHYQPDMSEAFLNIGLSYECQGKNIEAIKAYQNGKIKCPNIKEFQIRINNLQTQKNGCHLKHLLVDIDFASHLEPIPKIYAMDYLSAVPVLSSKAFETDELMNERLDLFATLPKPIFKK